VDTGREPEVREFFRGIQEMTYLRRLAGALAIVAAAALTFSAASGAADRTAVAEARVADAPADPGWP
jgi:hypothetical protein